MPLLDVPDLALHDPPVLLGMGLERLGEDVMLAGSVHGAGPGIQQALGIHVQAVSLPQNAVDPGQGRHLKGPAQPLPGHHLQLPERDAEVIAPGYIGRAGRCLPLRPLGMGRILIPQAELQHRLRDEGRGKLPVFHQTKGLMLLQVVRPRAADPHMQLP